MSKLKAISGHEIREDIDYNTRGIDPEDKEWCKYGKELCDTLYYQKSEADKVIADLEESHKKEVEQLLIEIAELKEHNENYRFDSNNMLHKIMKQNAEIRHHKYKRCLAMAQVLDHVCPMTNRKAKWRDKWRNRWLKIAEQFEPGKE